MELNKINVNFLIDDILLFNLNIDSKNEDFSDL